MEVGTAVYKNNYVSSFREDDDDYVAPDSSDANEIIADGVLGPGTQIEYFVTSAYICTAMTVHAFGCEDEPVIAGGRSSSR